MEMLIIYMLILSYYCFGVIACVWWTIDAPEFGLFSLFLIMALLWVIWPYWLYSEIMEERRRRKYHKIIRAAGLDK